MDDQQAETLISLGIRIAEALEAMAGTGVATGSNDWAASKLWLWQSQSRRLKPVTVTKVLSPELLVGIEAQKQTLFENTEQFARGFPANNVLLWGARGMGKSSVIKAIHGALSKTYPIHLIEIYREDISTLPVLMELLASKPDLRFILFCDDLSFDQSEAGYKSLKAMLDGGIATRPDNVLFYATSNRRHIVSRQMIENEQGSAIHPGESVEEKVSLSDRFGLWLGFYPATQDQYLEMVKGYAAAFGLTYDEAAAIEWYRTRGGRSGRVAWQYIQHEAGRQEKRI